MWKERMMDYIDEEQDQIEMTRRCTEYLGSEDNEAVINILCLIQKNLFMAQEVAMNYFFRTGDSMYYYIANGDSFKATAGTARVCAAM